MEDAMKVLKKIFDLPFTYYSTAQTKMESTTAMTKNTGLFVDQVSKPSVCSGLGQVSLSSGKRLHPTCSHCLCCPTLLLSSAEILSQSSAHGTVYLTLKFSYQLHHSAVAGKPKLFSIVCELNGARPSESTGLETL